MTDRLVWVRADIGPCAGKPYHGAWEPSGFASASCGLLAWEVRTLCGRSFDTTAKSSYRPAAARLCARCARLTP